MSLFCNHDSVKLFMTDNTHFFINETMLQRGALGAKFIAHLDATAPLKINPDKSEQRRCTDAADTSSVIGPILRLLQEPTITAILMITSIPPFNNATQGEPPRMLSCITRDVLRALDAYGMGELLNELRRVLEQPDAAPAWETDPHAVLGIGLHTHSDKLVQLGIKRIFSQDSTVLVDQGAAYLSDTTVGIMVLYMWACKAEVAAGLVSTAEREKHIGWVYPCDDCGASLVPVTIKWQEEGTRVHAWTRDVLEKARHLLAGRPPRDFVFAQQDFALTVERCDLLSGCVMSEVKEYVEDYCEEVVEEYEEKVLQELITW